MTRMRNANEKLIDFIINKLNNIEEHLFLQSFQLRQVFPLQMESISFHFIISVNTTFGDVF